MKFEVRKVVDVDKTNLDLIVDWMYEWWGKRNNRSREWVKHYMSHSFNENSLPISIVAFDEFGEAAGYCMVSMQDLDVRPDMYPWLAKVFVAPKYRGNGLVKRLLECAESEAKKLGFNKLYLYTSLENLYDKYDWDFLGMFETFKSSQNLQKFYSKDL